MPGRYGKLLREVKSKGYSILPSYYSESDIDTIKDEIKKTLNEREVNKIYVQEMPGSFRMKRMEKHSLSIKAMTQNFFWVLINFLYSLKLTVPVTMYSETKVTEKGMSLFAQQPHFDLFIHQLKIIIALDDVTESNGPTRILPYSLKFNFSLLKTYFKSFMTLKDDLNDRVFISNLKYENLLKNKKEVKVLLKKGDVVFFDSRVVHRASPVLEGERKLLWFYF